MHPAAGNWNGTLVNALLAHCGDSLSGIGGVRRPGIVHRSTRTRPACWWSPRTTRRIANWLPSSPPWPHRASHSGLPRLRLGRPERPKGTIDAPLERHPHARDKIAVRKGGREAVTHWERRELYAGEKGEPVASLLACTLETGRTHQIRVHLAHIGHPLLGDALYGSGFKTKATHLTEAGRQALTGLSRQALHAYLLGSNIQNRELRGVSVGTPG